MADFGIYHCMETSMNCIVVNLFFIYCHHLRFSLREYLHSCYVAHDIKKDIYVFFEDVSSLKIDSGQ